MYSSFLQTSILQFKYYKSLGYTNSIAIIVQHLNGNMLSRFTNFLTEDGEKPWRKRDQEFVAVINTKEELLKIWEEGWTCLFNTLESLQESNLQDIVYIRNQGHTVLEAITRQLCHYSYHVGQIVFIGTLIRGKDWQNLSIPKGNSKEFNEAHFLKPKAVEHFTNNLRNK